jgi:hypothetical protein
LLFHANSCEHVVTSASTVRHIAERETDDQKFDEAMKRNYFLFISLFIMFLSAPACLDEIRLDGNGILKTENRILSGFSEVICSSNFRVNITRGNEFNVSVEAESNLLPYIKTEVNRGKLDIGVRGIHILENTLPMDVNIVMPALNAITVSGSGEVNTGMFIADHFDIVVSGSGNVNTLLEAGTIEVTVSGSGNVEMEGIADEAEMLVSGSGEIYAFEFPLLKCRATLSGSGRIYVDAHDFLDAIISGSGSVYYRGNPRIDSRISGTGRIIKSN